VQTMKEKKDYSYAMIAIVAIVAIVAIIVMVMQDSRTIYATQPEVQQAITTSGFTQEETRALEEIAEKIGEGNVAGNAIPYYSCDDWEAIIDRGCDNVGTSSPECIRAIIGFLRVCRGIIV